MAVRARGLTFIALAAAGVAVLLVPLLRSCSSQVPSLLSVLYRTDDIDAEAPAITPVLRLINTSDQLAALASITLRYYFTAASVDARYDFSCLSAELGCEIISGSVHMGVSDNDRAHTYAEIGFTAHSGSLGPGADSGDIRVVAYRTDGQAVNQADDYSFHPTREFAAAPTIAAFVDGRQVWGSAPDDRPSPVRTDPVASAADASSGSTAGATASPSGAPGSTQLANPDNIDTSAGLFFDDFNYVDTNAASFRQVWTVRTGISSAGGLSWSSGNVGFVNSGPDRALRLVASTDGSADGTTQAMVRSSQPMFFAGTYGLRVRYDDTPDGKPGANVVQAFSTSAPRRAYSDSQVSQMDTQYLPAGGWRDSRRQLDLTTYYAASTGTADSRSGIRAQSFDGWHTLVMQVGVGAVVFYVDDTEIYATSGRYYPRDSMYIVLSQWFIANALGTAGARCSYDYQVDWVYYVADRIVSPARVLAQVQGERSAHVALVDSIHSSSPTQPSGPPDAQWDQGWPYGQGGPYGGSSWSGGTPHDGGGWGWAPG
jgi:hypothetical protein